MDPEKTLAQIEQEMIGVMTQTKHIPLRKCTGCQQMKSKKELIRLIRTPEGQFVIDETGKKNGRGAYLCPSIECFEKALKNKGFERSLKGKVPPETFESLKKEIESIDAG